MRLWHQDLIPFLPRQQLLGQHRECCAMRGNGWGKKHSTVNYVWLYPPRSLYEYHFVVMLEMNRRGYNIDNKWFEDDQYRGKKCERWKPVDMYQGENKLHANPIYPEHDDEYMRECLENLGNKGIIIDFNRNTKPE